MSASLDTGQLASGLSLLDVSTPNETAQRLADFGAAIVEANRSTNLVGAKTLGELVPAHFLDSIAGVRGVALESPIVDVGSGAGFPGIPIAITRPGSRVVLFEPRRKRAEFLRGLVSAQRIGNVEVEQITAETAGRGSWREHAGSVLIRAVARPRVALELGLPLLRQGGVLVLYVGREPAPSAGDLSVASKLGGELAKAQPVQVPYLAGERHVWTFVKAAKTPPGYPRRSGIPGREPLES